MPRLIFKCPHLKPGRSGEAGRYVRYIATREGVERADPGRGLLPTTKIQREMMEQLLRDFPSSRELFEYGDYQSAPTRANASEFITRAIEDNCDQMVGRDGYVSYIAKRPRAERSGTHGLFSGGDGPVDLSYVAEQVGSHPGTVWCPIISLRREDAARLGYDSAAQWQELLRGFAPRMAEAMKIPANQFRWYAAFHDEGHHPHIHMVCYSADGRSGFLSKQGIAEIKSGLAKEIFRQELTEIYREQTRSRDELVEKAEETIEDLIQQMRSGTLENPRMERLMTDLAHRLRHTKGKNQYGYLKAPLKSIVDEIVDQLARDDRVSAAYELWYQLREDVLRTYKDDLPPRLRLSQQKEFRRIKNLVIEEAVRLGEFTEIVPQEEPELHESESDILSSTDEPPEAGDKIPSAMERLTKAAEAGSASAQYALGKLYRERQELVQASIWFAQAAEQGYSYAMYALGKLHLEVENTDAALRWFQRAAELGNPYAQCALGKLYLLGKGVSQDRVAAVHWLTASAEQGNQHAQWVIDRLDDVPSVLTSATRLLRHMGRIFEEQTPYHTKGFFFVDSKLRQKIREKKIAMGHKADDHEGQEIELR